jgi:hypothetical protein
MSPIFAKVSRSLNGWTTASWWKAWNKPPTFRFTLIMVMICMRCFKKQLKIPNKKDQEPLAHKKERTNGVRERGNMNPFSKAVKVTR